MHNTFFSVLGLIAPFCLAATIAMAAPPAKTAEDRYIAARDAAIQKISAIYDAGNRDEDARKAEEAANADLLEQMRVILSEPDRDGFGPPKLNIDTFSKGDEGFGTLDGMRFDAKFGSNGETAGQNGADGKYVEPKSHIIITTRSLFERWLRAHKDWWGKKTKNVPQQIGAALKDESFYTQATSSGAAVVNFNSLPIEKPARRKLRPRHAGRTNPIRTSRRRRPCVRLGDRQWQGLHRLWIDRSASAGTGLPRHPERLHQEGRAGSRRPAVQEKSAARPTINSATSDKRETMLTSVVSPRMRQIGRSSPRPGGRRRGYCRQPSIRTEQVDLGVGEWRDQGQSKT